MSELVQAGWKADPTGRHDMRHWDGEAWTDQVIDDGIWNVDPVEGKPKQGFVSGFKSDLTKDLPKWAIPKKRMPAPQREAAAALELAVTHERQAMQAYRARIVRAQRTLAQAISPPPISSLPPLALYSKSIVTPEGTFPLTPAVTATVDAAGNYHSVERSTGTRMIAGGVLLGATGVAAGAAARKTIAVDKRELYLMIDGGTWYATYPCMPTMGAEVRQFAMALNVTARNVDSTPDPQELVDGWAQELQKAKHDYADAARAHYAVVECEQALEQARAISALPPPPGTPAEDAPSLSELPPPPSG